ncbi:hypothetical protein, partial [Thermogladius sp.]|uniref:hypothetical protein n=1 Tax=Thermogladius sp. TaxID=2023064 RepID=UPI003D0B7D18
YWVSYYKNVSLIVNGDSKTYYAYLKVVNPATGLPQDSQLVLYVYKANANRSLSGYPTPAPESASYIASLNLTTTSWVNLTTIPAGGAVEIDLYVYIPEGYQLPAPVTAQLLLVYSPSSEQPP